jgi:hypothetical protein
MPPKEEVEEEPNGLMVEETPPKEDDWQLP